MSKISSVLKFSPNVRQGNKPLTNKPPEMIDDIWTFYNEPPKNVSGQFVSMEDAYWYFRSPDYPLQGVTSFPATKTGWISADDNPPVSGNYLTYNRKFGWGRRHWDGQWFTNWNIEMWKPVITPEKEDSDRYEIKYESSKCYVVRDNKADIEFGGFWDRQTANELIDYLKDINKDQGRCL